MTDRRIITLKHRTKPTDRPAYFGDILEQAIRAVAPTMADASPANFHHMHPNIVRLVDREYSRLLEIRK